MAPRDSSGRLGGRPEIKGEDCILLALEMIIYGAAPMSPDRLLEGMRIFGNVFVQFYGQTEVPQCITTLRKIDHDPARPRRCSARADVRTRWSR